MLHVCYKLYLPTKLPQKSTIHVGEYRGLVPMDLSWASLMRPPEIEEPDTQYDENYVGGLITPIFQRYVGIYPI